jgi:nucleotide-binding universal stress UspA family protein
MAPRIAVPLDGSLVSQQALPVALGIARRRGAVLDLVTVAGPTPEEGGAHGGGPEAPGSRESWISRGEELLHTLEGVLRRGGHDGEITRSVLPPGNVASTLVTHFAATGVDLAVLSTHGRGPLERAWLGSVADGVLRQSPCPVLLIRSESGGDDEGASHAGPSHAGAQAVADGFAAPPPPERILVPVDGSSASASVLGALTQIAAPSAEVIVLRVVPPFIPGGSPYLPHTLRSPEDHDRIVEHARTGLDQLIADAGVQARRVVPLVVTAGTPADGIFETAGEWEIDLIAMSTSGRGGVARFLLGSVADKVIRGGSCPVLLLPRKASLDS